MNLLIKPASGLCNMRCRYCFYTDEMNRRETGSYGIMSDATLRETVRRVFEYSEKDGFVGLMFQGGEPTLAGLDFYKRLMEYIAEFNTKKLRVNLGLQTNGYDMTEEFAKFLADNKFLVGLSVDGTKDIHNANRKDAAGKDTFGRVMHTAKLFDTYGVTYNTITVITSQTARSATAIYNFFKKHGFVWQQYIPCLSPLGNSGVNSDVNPDGSAPEYDDNNTSEFLSAEEYGSFLCRIFDLWYSDMISGRYIYNRTFENYVGILMGRHPEECGMCGFCTVQYVLEADGGVYPCDFYVLDAYRLGNFVTDPLEDINRRANELGFVAESRQINEKCRTCRYVALCRGGCRRNREPFIVAEDGSKVPSLNRFCRSYEMFFEHSADRLMTLARLAMRRG